MGIDADGAGGLMQISGETDRMEWYLAGVDSIHRRYQMLADPAEKIRALAEMEALA